MKGLGKPALSKMDEFPENFRRGGGGSFPIKKKIVLETAVLVMKKLQYIFQKRGHICLLK